MTQLEITGQLILGLFKIVVRCLNRQATSVPIKQTKKCEDDFEVTCYRLQMSHQEVIQ